MLLECLSLEAKASVTAQSMVEAYPRNGVIFARGDVPTQLHILHSGTVTICNYTPNGERKVITTISTAGDSFGEVYLFLDQQPYEFFAVAETECMVQHIPKEVAFSNPALMAELLHLFARKAYTLNRRVQVLSSPSLREKLLIYIEQSKDANNQVHLTGTRDELADWLNTTRPSLSRELMQMQAQGLIRVDKRTITKV
ncbi:Crp/Fnr family transcriptional regulator [Bengtsoniella intestinalis]|uniref:Crp/Fnr family transcriptional regulator n=1 Tax=Bengtsoniella intestinalis TaxID=3073143 RepID=UPI00391F1637